MTTVEFHATYIKENNIPTLCLDIVCPDTGMILEKVVVMPHGDHDFKLSSVPANKDINIRQNEPDDTIYPSVLAYARLYGRLVHIIMTWKDTTNYMIDNLEILDPKIAQHTDISKFVNAYFDSILETM